MSEEKVGCGVVGGGVLGVFVAISAFKEGKPWSEILLIIPIMMAVATIAVFWFTRNMDTGGGTMTNSIDDVRSLQRQLRVAIQNAADAEAKGNHSYAAHFRAQAAVIESQLRSYGA